MTDAGSVAGNLFRELPDLTASAVPAHQVIEQWLMRLITRRELLVGDRLPPEGQLAEMLGVSRMTLRQALASLEARGILQRRRGRGGGTFVVEPKIECDLTGLAGFTEQMRRASMRAGARVVHAGRQPARRAVAQALGIDVDSDVFELVRVRSANREPLALERSYLPVEIFPDLLDQQLSGSLYALMRRKYGQAPHHSVEALEPVIASVDEARLLNVAAGSPLLLIERTAYSSVGTPIECAFDLYRPDRTRISVRTGVTVEPDMQTSARTR